MTARAHAPGADPLANDLAFRPATEPELLACADIWHESTSDYLARLATQAPPMVLEPFMALMRHLRGTDPARFLVAVEGPDERVLGFASAIQREHVWFLGMLFVRPEAQGRGLGRALLTRVFPGDGRPGAADVPDGEPLRPGIMATCTDSAQPISNALYASYGIVPRIPMLDIVGRPSGPDALPALPAGIQAVPFEGEASLPTEGGASLAAGATVGAAVAAIDRQLLGYAHSEDHAYLRQADRRGFVYRDADGTPLGYGYTSAAGRVGPLAVLDETLLAPVLGHLLTAIPPRGASVLWVPGCADRAVVALLRAGFRLEGFPGLLCSTRPFGAFDRYLPISLAVL